MRQSTASLAAWLCVFAWLASAAEQNVVLLWPNGAPGSEGKTAPEKVRLTPEGEHVISSVHQPSLTVYLPPSETATGAAVVIAPGGSSGCTACDAAISIIPIIAGVESTAGIRGSKAASVHSGGITFSTELSSPIRGRSGSDLGSCRPSDVIAKIHFRLPELPLPRFCAGPGGCARIPRS